MKTCLPYFVFSVILSTFVCLTFYISSSKMIHNKESVTDRVILYETMRRNIMDRELNAQLGGFIMLNRKEQEVNDRLIAEKRMEFEGAFRNFINFKPTQNFLQMQEEISNTTLFKLLKRMPKGGILHAHDTALCSVNYLIKDLTYRDNLWICMSKDNKTFERLRFSQGKPKLRIPAPCKWVLLKDLREYKGFENVDNMLREEFTMTPYDDVYDSDAAWIKFRRLVKLVHGLLTYAPVWADYYQHALEELYADGVQYLELRSSIPILYQLNGTHYSFLDTVHVLWEVTTNFQAKHADFIGSKIIYAPSRNASDHVFDSYIANARKLKETFPYYFAGLDLVAYGEGSRPLRDFAHKLLAIKDEINFYFHAGESNWLGASNDENLLDALLLGSKRIGHGYALPKHPEMLRFIKRYNVAIEVNPISNQVLRHLNDLHNHPAATLFAAGYSVILSSDDPSVWKASPLTHDFYMAFMGIASMTTDLRFLKMLAANSINYSAMDRLHKDKAIDMWTKKWNEWIDELVDIDSGLI